MAKPVYPKENTLLVIAAIIAAIFWIGAIIATKGMVLAIIPVFFLVYLFVQSGFISYLKGTGALVSDAQFPDIQQRAKTCAQKVHMKVLPKIYILHGNGMFNAFATRFLRKDYIILLSDVLDALEDHPEAINFYIGHEMGHIDRKHLLIEPFLSLALVLPLLGAAYSRAREYTCDQYGAACCASPAAAQQAVALLAVGGRRYKTIHIPSYLEQIHETSGFWMSFHELIGSYPWLVKRFAKISPNFQAENIPSRNALAYLPAIFVPRLNVMSFVVIYALFLGLTVGGVLKGQELIKNAEMGAEESFSESGLLASTAEEINKTTPQKIDDVTTLEYASTPAEDTLVYHYTISKPATEIDFSQVESLSRPAATEYWCKNEDAAFFRDNGIKLIYRYMDINVRDIGDILIDLSDPQTCGQSE